MNSEVYIGLMSGTSMDAIDVAVVDFSKQPLELLATHSEPILPSLKERLIALCMPGDNGVFRLGGTDVELGHALAQAALNGLRKTNIKASDVIAIGSHGQTVRHMPNSEFPFTLQIGDPNIIALRTGITTVADFRRRDVAAGGQGAPLAPAFHRYLFADEAKKRIILNIGGIANITVLNGGDVIGFDTGPGNTLLDAWCIKYRNRDFDQNGEWARSGKINEELLTKLLRDDYFKKTPPKSTGREYFNLPWLNTFLNAEKPEDVQATLTALTAQSIADAITPYASDAELIVCGGGVHNTFLMEQLRQRCKNIVVNSTEALGVDPDWIEAMAFAWLAKQTLENQPGNIPSVTGAEVQTTLGGIYPA